MLARDPTAILLIEDNGDHARAIAIMIAAANPTLWTLVHAESVSGAAERAREQPPSLILLDLHLPDGHGLALIERVRAFAPLTPIVVLTATDDEELATHAVVAGAQDYLVKGLFDTKGLKRAIEHALARHELLADLEHARSRAAQRATHDDLTGLPNRVLFFDRLGHAIDRCVRTGTRLAVVFIDLDGFKEINDTSGHATGDEILRAVADRLRTSARASDTVARLGGDEFTILYEPSPDRGTADALVHHLRGKFAEPFVIESSSYLVSISAGIALYPEDGRDPRELLQVADTAMYAAKAAARSLR